MGVGEGVEVDVLVGVGQRLGVGVTVGVGVGVAVLVGVPVGVSVGGIGALLRSRQSLSFTAVVGQAKPPLSVSGDEITPISKTVFPDT